MPQRPTDKWLTSRKGANVKNTQVQPLTPNPWLSLSVLQLFLPCLLEAEDYRERKIASKLE
jgi:hypothetical protein